MEVDFLAHHPASAPIVGQWLFEAFSPVEPGVSLLQYQQRMIERLSVEGSMVACVSLENGVLAGTASLIEDDGIASCADLSPWLADVYVSPPYRNGGHGEALTQFIIEHAKRCGHRRLYLYTADRQAFFASLGWRLLKEADHHGVRVSVMELAL
ncbi:MAG TPA: GNAT family N-acetyltransferase [Burkholderiales bacterium]|nr:GNAT family N-acetyltransferase [Burkholderiales bacterium]